MEQTPTKSQVLRVLMRISKFAVTSPLQDRSIELTHIRKRIPCPKRGGGQAGGQTGGQTMVQAGGQAGGQGNSVQQRPGQHRSPQSQSSGGKRVVDVRMLSCFRPETGESTPCSPDLLAREGALDANFPHGRPASSQGQGGTVQAQQPRPQGQAMQPPTQQVQSGGQQQVAEQQQPPQLGQGGQVSTQQTEQPTDGSSSPKDPELDAAIRDFLSKNDIPNKTGPHTDNKPPPASTTTRVDATLNIDEDGTLGDGETKTTSDTSEEKETASASSQPPPVPEMVPTPKATPSLSPERLARYGNSPS